MVIEEFWSPSNKPTPLDGDQKISIAQKGKRPHPFRLPFNNMNMSNGGLKFLIAKKGGVQIISFFFKNHPPPQIFSHHKVGN
jgi:hypothetical protein